MPATRPRRMLVANPRAPPARLRTCEARARRRRRALDPPRGARRVADRARAARAGGDGRAGGRRHAGRALSGPGIAVVLGDLPRLALRKAPPRADPQDPTLRA